MAGRKGLQTGGTTMIARPTKVAQGGKTEAGLAGGGVDDAAAGMAAGLAPLTGDDAAPTEVCSQGPQNGSEAKRRPVVPWATVRLAYEETQERVDELAQRFGVCRQTVQRKARDEGWIARRPDLVAGPRARRKEEGEPDMAAMGASLKRIVAAMVCRLEARVMRAGEDGVDDRDVRTATALMAAIAKAKDLAPSQGSPRVTDSPSQSAPAAGTLARSVLDALEAIVDGRAAGVDRPPE